MHRVARVQATLRHLNPVAVLSATEFGSPVDLPPIPAGTEPLTDFSTNIPAVKAVKLAVPDIGQQDALVFIGQGIDHDLLRQSLARLMG